MPNTQLARRLRDSVNLGVANRTLIGYPPSVRTPRIGINQAGDLTLQGLPLSFAPLPSTLVIPSQAALAGMQPVPRPTQDTDNLGEMQTVPIVFAGAGEMIALRRPQGRRVELTIQNLTVVGNVFYCFDRTADNATCIAIGPGGNRIFDKGIPQGDLHIFSSGAGTVVIEYMNK